MVYLKLQNVGLSNDKKRRLRKTPVKTLQGLQRLSYPQNPSVNRGDLFVFY